MYNWLTIHFTLSSSNAPQRGCLRGFWQLLFDKYMLYVLIMFVTQKLNLLIIFLGMLTFVLDLFFF